MSMPSNTKITCPKCNHESDYIVWYSINVTLNPEMKDKILDDTLFSWVCPHCGENYYVPYDFLYHDMENGLFTWYRNEELELRRFADMIRLVDNHLDYRKVWDWVIAYHKDHPDDMLYFDHLEGVNDDDKTLVFSIFRESEEHKWVKTADTYSQLLSKL